MGLRTGDEYLEGLKDEREIWYDGRRLGNIVDEPGFRSTALTVAQYYDMQTNPDLQDLMTYETPDGDRAHLSFMEPRSVDDLRRRAAAYGAWAEVTGGMMGRAPDYMNACMMAVGAARHVWGSKDPARGEAAYNLYLHCRRDDVCMTHTFVNPMVDRFTPLAEQERFINTGIVDQDDNGIYVTGARMVGTLAPFCDENILFVAPLGITDPRDDIYAVGFQSKVAMPGLKWICRDVLDPERPHFDQPLATRFDEMDCIAVYENAFIPWEDVFIAKDIEIHNSVVPGMKFMPALGHHVVVKNVAKTRFLFGLAHLLAESSQVSNFINVQDRLGDILMWLQTMESIAIAAVEGAELNPDNGLYYCNEAAINAGLRIYPEAYCRIVDHLYQLGGGGYVSIPQEATLELADLAIDRYYKGATAEAKDKVALFRLAWDVCGTSWGGRQELYERFFFGDTQRMKSLSYQFYDKSEAAAMVARLLTPPQGRERLAWPDKYRPSPA